MNLVLAATGGKTMWYLTRGSGVVSLLLITASVVLGVLTAGRWEARRWPRFVVEGLHRNISLVVLVFLAIHIATTVLDGFVPIGWLDVIIPFRSGYRPVWVGFGTLAVDCLLAIVITSLLRVRIGLRIWRYVHLLSYACWPIALVHGLGTGTDSPERWMVALDVVSVASVLVVVWWRIAVRRPAHPVAAPLAFAASAVLPVALVLFAWNGPLRADWGKHGGRLGAPSPTTVGAAPAGSAGATPTAPGLPLPLAASIRGTRTVSEQGTLRRVSLVGRSVGSSPVDVRIDLTGGPDQSGGVVLEGGTVSVGVAGAAPAWQGPVAGLRGDTVTADLTGPGGSHAGFTAQLAIDRSTGILSGTVRLAVRTSHEGSN